jgi:hypothetical protein
MEDDPMSSRVLISVLAGCLVIAVGAEPDHARAAVWTATAQSRSVEVFVQALNNTDFLTDDDGRTAPDFAPFEALVSKQVAVTSSPTADASASASQSSAMSAAGLAAAAGAEAVTHIGDNGQETGQATADADSSFETTFTVDVMSPWVLSGTLSSFGFEGYASVGLYRGEELVFQAQASHASVPGPIERVLGLGPATEYEVVIQAHAAAVDEDSASAGFDLALAPWPNPMGDANGDGAVDDDDLSLLLAHWGQDAAWEDGNFNTDAVVNDDDLSLLLANWTGPLASTVPEPATIALLAVTIPVVFRSRRRN